jgi:MFS family permease
MASIRALQRLSIFDSLHNRDYRWFWLGRLASSATYQMGSVAQGWLVLELTGSALALGWVSSGWSIANSTLSLYGGVVTDRIEKRRILLWTRGLITLSALAIAVLIAAGSIQVWHLATYSLFRGVIFALMMPAQNAYLADLIDRKTMLNAVSLNSVGMGLAGLFAGPLAGLLIDRVGIHAVYFGIALSYSFAFFTLTRLPLTGHSDSGTSSVWADLSEGIKYLRLAPVLIPLLGLVLARGLLAMPYRTFMPNYAKDVMGLDAVGLGFLSSAPGLGSLFSSLTLASLGNFQHKGRLLLIAGIVMGSAIFAFGNAQSLPVALLVLVVVGAASNVCMVTNQTLLQVNSAERFRGRVMSMYMMMFGLTQLGAVPTGALVDLFGVSLVLAVQGALFAVVCVLVLLLIPSMRRLE